MRYSFGSNPVAFFSQRSSSERLIATARVGLSVFSLLAIYLDSASPIRYSDLTLPFLLGYIGYSTLLAIVVRRLRAFSNLWRIFTHIIDLFVFAFLMYFTQGPTSLSFVFFIYSLVCGMLKWGWRGVFWTTVAALTLVLGMLFQPVNLLNDPTFELDSFIIRIAYLVVIAILLGYVGAYEERIQEKISGAASWKRNLSKDLTEIAHQLSENAANIIRSPHLFIIWEENEEPWLHMAEWNRGKFHYKREASVNIASLVAEPLLGASFLCFNPSAASPSVLYASPGGLKTWKGVPVSVELLAKFAKAPILSIPMDVDGMEGRIFALGIRGMTSDDLVMGNIVIDNIAAHLDEFYLLKRLREMAVLDEHNHMARDLHDGLLQSLTAAALQLETTSRLLEIDPQAARQGILSIQQLIAAEQRDLRSLIQEMKSSPYTMRTTQANLVGRLEALGERFKRHWGLEIALDVRFPRIKISDALAQEIYFLLHEAFINTARHAGATAARAELFVRDNLVCISVGDNGKGFLFQGRHDHESLAVSKLGPKTLRERTTSLGGSLSILSTESGATVDIVIPLPQAGA